MKKIFTVILTVLILLSMGNVFAFAAANVSPEPTVVPVPTINPVYLPRPTPILNPPDEDDIIEIIDEAGLIEESLKPIRKNRLSNESAKRRRNRRR